MLSRTQRTLLNDFLHVLGEAGRWAFETSVLLRFRPLSGFRRRFGNARRQKESLHRLHLGSFEQAIPEDPTCVVWNVRGRGTAGGDGDGSPRGSASAREVVPRCAEAFTGWELTALTGCDSKSAAVLRRWRRESDGSVWARPSNARGSGREKVVAEVELWRRRHADGTKKGSDFSLPFLIGMFGADERSRTFTGFTPLDP